MVRIPHTILVPVLFTAAPQCHPPSHSVAAFSLAPGFFTSLGLRRRMCSKLPLLQRSVGCLARSWLVRGALRALKTTHCRRGYLLVAPMLVRCVPCSGAPGVPLALVLLLLTGTTAVLSFTGTAPHEARGCLYFSSCVWGEGRTRPSLFNVGEAFCRTACGRAFLRERERERERERGRERESETDEQAIYTSDQATLVMA